MTLVREPLPLENIRKLKKSMINAGWKIDSFLFDYNDYNYIVLISLYDEGEPKPKYASMKIEFIDSNDETRIFCTSVNASSIKATPSELRTYFHINVDNPNIGHILNQFSILFGRCIPTDVNVIKSDRQKNEMVRSLSKSDKEDPNALYCYMVKRNGKKADGRLAQRSMNNDNKTRLLRLNLYNKYKNDTNISFCYKDDPNMEKSDKEIMENFARSQK